MPIVPNFSTSQVLGLLKTLTITDTSTGSDASVTSRQITLMKHDGTYLVQSGSTTNYIVWAIASTSLDILNILDRDYMLNITVNWMNGSTVVYSKTLLQQFKGYALSYSLDLTRFAASNPKLLNDKNYFESQNKLQTLMDDADQVIVYSNDQLAGQLFLNMAKELIDNQVYFF